MTAPSSVVGRLHQPARDVLTSFAFDFETYRPNGGTFPDALASAVVHGPDAAWWRACAAACYGAYHHGARAAALEVALDWVRFYEQKIDLQACAQLESEHPCIWRSDDPYCPGCDAHWRAMLDDHLDDLAAILGESPVEDIKRTAR